MIPQRVLQRVLGVLLAMASVHAQAHIASCPQRLNVLDKRGELVDAKLFIGLPEKGREQKRTSKHRQWVLANLHKRAIAMKDDLFLQCRYKGMKASVTVPVPPTAIACVISNGSKGETRIRCE